MSSVMAMVPGRLLEEDELGNKKSRRITTAGAINKNIKPRIHARKTDTLTSIQPRNNHKRKARILENRRIAMVACVLDMSEESQEPIKWTYDTRIHK